MKAAYRERCLPGQLAGPPEKRRGLVMPNTCPSSLQPMPGHHVGPGQQPGTLH